MIPLALLLLATAAAPVPIEPAWTPRHPPVAPPAGHELRDPGRWPAEPTSPDVAEVDPERFADAVAALCRHAARRSLGAPILVASAAAGVDPFLLAALAFDQSGCDHRLWTPSGFGLLRLHPAMYFRAGHPPEPVSRADLEPERLLDVAHSLRVGARLLAMWDERHRWEGHAGVRHRSGVSHFVWGDVVGSSADEDRILTARRRLLERYRGAAPPRATALGLQIVSPLEGAPRVATSGLGEDRDGGARRHRGLDIAGTVGEPVRSIADGVVVFAGLDLPGTSSHEVLSPRQSARWSSALAGAESGPGGLFVCIDHDRGTLGGFPDPPAKDSARQAELRPRDHERGTLGGFPDPPAKDSARQAELRPRDHDPRPASSRETVTSCYFHLRRYFVRRDERVVAGEAIGEVGLSGVKTSLPHLHFEVHVADHVRNPVPLLGELIIPPRETVAYRNAIRNHRVRLERNGASPPAPADGINVSVRQHGHAGRAPLRDRGNDRDSGDAGAGALRSRT